VQRVEIAAVSDRIRGRRAPTAQRRQPLAFDDRARVRSEQLHIQRIGCAAACFKARMICGTLRAADCGERASRCSICDRPPRRRTTATATRWRSPESRSAASGRLPRRRYVRRQHLQGHRPAARGGIVRPTRAREWPSSVLSDEQSSGRGPRGRSSRSRADQRRDGRHDVGGHAGRR